MMRRWPYLTVLVLSSMLCTALYLYASGDIPRDSRGRIKRSAAAVAAFKLEHECPGTGEVETKCPGYVVDHIIPLACGGPDIPLNMQWQDVASAKEKDTWERDCKRWIQLWAEAEVDE